MNSISRAGSMARRNVGGAIHPLNGTLVPATAAIGPSSTFARPARAVHSHLTMRSVIAIRHGETAWSLNGRHTGTTDIPLTDNGRRLARRLRPALTGHAFALVLVSPLQRARETCALTGLGDEAVVDADLVEWNYGDYEGLTPAHIHARAPGWLIFRDGCPGGETPDDVGARADRVIARVRAVERAVDGDVAVFAH